MHHPPALALPLTLQPVCRPLLQALAELFKPTLHTLLLIWQHSRHWNTAPRLVAVLREVCNDLIMQARKFVPGGCCGSVLGWAGEEEAAV